MQPTIAVVPTDERIACGLLSRSGDSVFGSEGVVTDKGDDEGAGCFSKGANQETATTTDLLDRVEGRNGADERDDAEDELNLVGVE